MLIFVGTDYAGGRQFQVSLSDDAVTEDLIGAVGKHESLQIGTFALHHSSSDLPVCPRSLLSKQGITHLTSIHLFIYADLQAREAAKRQAFEEEARRRGRYIAKDGKERLRRRTRKELAEIRRKEAERIPGFRRLLVDADGLKNGRPLSTSLTTATATAIATAVKERNGLGKRRFGGSHITCPPPSALSTSTSTSRKITASPITPTTPHTLSDTTTTTTTTTPTPTFMSDRQRQRVQKNTGRNIDNGLPAQKNNLLSSTPLPLRLRLDPSISSSSSSSRRNHQNPSTATNGNTSASASASASSSNCNTGNHFGNITPTTATTATSASMDDYRSHSSSPSIDEWPIPTSTSARFQQQRPIPLHRLVDDAVPEPRSARHAPTDLRWLRSTPSPSTRVVDPRSQYLPQRQPTSPTGNGNGAGQTGTSWEMGSYHWLGR